MLDNEFVSSDDTEETERERQIRFDYEHRDDEKKIEAMYGGPEGMANLRLLTEAEVVDQMLERIQWRLDRPEEWGGWVRRGDERDFKILSKRKAELESLSVQETQED